MHYRIIILKRKSVRGHEPLTGALRDVSALYQLFATMTIVIGEGTHHAPPTRHHSTYHGWKGKSRNSRTHKAAKSTDLRAKGVALVLAFQLSTAYFKNQIVFVTDRFPALWSIMNGILRRSINSFLTNNHMKSFKIYQLSKLFQLIPFGPYETNVKTDPVGF